LHHVMVALLLPPVAQYPELFGERFVIRHDNAPFAAGAEILAWIEAEASGRAYAAGPAAVIACAMRLAGILDDGNAVTVRDRHDGIHRCHLPIEMHGHDSPRAGRDRRFELDG